MDIESSIKKNRERIESRDKEVEDHFKYRRGTIKTKYLLKPQAVDYVKNILEDSMIIVTSKKVAVQINTSGLQWRHRDGKGYAIDQLEGIARRMASAC